MDAAQWSQQVTSLPKQMEEITGPNLPNNDPNNILTNPRNPTQQQRTRPQKDQIINCPRCNSTNTKFCYYNNYSFTQPRYFCKTCRRYWTQGGSLRSVPVGGGSRKNKRSSSSSSGLLSSSTLSPTTIPPPMHNKLIIPDLNPPTSFSNLLNSSQNPNLKFPQGHDLNLAFPIQGLFHHQLPKIEGNNNNNHENNHEENININSNNNVINNNNISSTITANTPSTASTPISALELLRSGITSTGNINQPFVPIPMSDPNTMYQSGYPNLQEFKPNMNIFSSLAPSIEHNTNNMGLRPDNNNNNNNNVDLIGGGARLLFPFADMNKLATNTHQQQHQDDQNKGNGNDNVNNNHRSGYWNGMLSGGTWSNQSYH